MKNKHHNNRKLAFNTPLLQEYSICNDVGVSECVQFDSGVV